MNLNCPHCEYAAVSSTDLQLHIHTYHSRLKTFNLECPICKKLYKLPSSFFRHMKMYHCLNTWQEVYDAVGHLNEPCTVCGEVCEFEHRTKDLWGYRTLCAEHYRIEQLCTAQKKTRESFKKYEGGHPSRDPIVIEKIKSINLKRYGVEYSGQSSVVKDKIKRTFSLNYNSGHPLSDPFVRAKSSSTNLKRYGHENAAKSEFVRNKLKKERSLELHAISEEEIRHKIEDTTLERYGVKHIFQSDIFKEKSRATCKKKYGCDHPMQSIEVRKKVEETNIERYGKPNTFQVDIFKEKSKQTMLGRFGVEYPGQSTVIQTRAQKTSLHRHKTPFTSQRDIDVNALFILNDRGQLGQLLKTKTPQEVAEALDVHWITVYRYIDRHRLECKKSRSSGETVLSNFLESNYHNKILINSRKIIGPLELDFYLPEHKLAIEYNGVYWHSELSGKKDKNYHLEKTQLCEAKGIQLLHIFSTDDFDIWKSVIMAKLGVTQRIYARECNVSSVNIQDSRIFLEENHLQGYTNSSVQIGLYFEGVLLSLMTFGAPRFNKSYSYELIRFCNKKGYSVVGGASRLLKHSGVISCISYANRRWSDGRLYDTLGFEKIGMSRPNYFYTRDYYSLYSRHKFQKHKLSSIVDDFDPLLTEWKNMANNGYDRIFDSGNLTYRLKL